MALNIFKWIFDKAKNENKKINITTQCYSIASEVMIRELAFNLVVNKIANAMSKCKVNVYYGGKKTKDEEWYRWNISPNKNQNASEFWHKLIYMLYSHNEALVIINNNELYVADSYNLNDNTAFFEYTFNQVQINNLTLQKTFRMSEVFYFKLNFENLRFYLNQTLILFGGLINAAYSNYLVSNGYKGVLKIDMFAEQEEDFEEYFSQLVNEDFKKFFSNPNAVIPLYQGYDYKQLDSKGNTDTRDFKNLLSDIIEITANAFNMPASIANGTVQDTSKAIDEFLTFCIDPLIEILTDEINRKLFSKQQLINNYYIKFDTKSIKHIDLIDIGTSIEKLISSGFTCVNDLREACGLDLINEEWANQFFMTKNYATIEELMNSMKGGDG